MEFYVKKNIVVGFCAYDNPNDKQAWSGIFYFMKKSLQKHYRKVIAVGYKNYKLEIFKRDFWRKTIRLYEIIFKKQVTHEKQEFDMGQFHENLIEFAQINLVKEIKKNKYDLLFFPSGSFLLANLNTVLPTLYLSDSTAKLMVGYYPDFMELSDHSKKLCLGFEKEAINKASKIIYASKWAARSAIEDYNCQEEKINIIPFGANLEIVLSRDDVLLRRKSLSDSCILLFVGLDWIRKGGQIAFETMLDLNKRGINAELIICGCTPPGGLRHDKLRVMGFLDKNNNKQMHRLANFYMDAAFFIFPSRAECAGIACCEAAAYGLPVIATDTGGVSTYVGDRINGRLLPLAAGSSAYAKIIEEIWKDKDLYINMCENSRDKYEKELSWDVWGERVSEIIDTLVG